MEVKKNTDMKIKQMREQAIRDIKNASINIGFKAVERLMSKSLDKSKLDKLYNESVEETKLALKKNSVRIGHRYMAKKIIVIGSDLVA